MRERDDSGYEQFEIYLETIEQELRPVSCEQRRRSRPLWCRFPLRVDINLSQRLSIATRGMRLTLCASRRRQWAYSTGQVPSHTFLLIGRV